MSKLQLTALLVLWSLLLIIYPVAIYKLNQKEQSPKEIKQLVHQTITQNQQQATLVFSNTKIPAELKIKELIIECETSLFKNKCKQDPKQLLSDCVWFTSVSVLNNIYIRCITLNQNATKVR